MPGHPCSAVRLPCDCPAAWERERKGKGRGKGKEREWKRQEKRERKGKEEGLLGASLPGQRAACLPDCLPAG